MPQLPERGLRCRFERDDDASGSPGRECLLERTDSLCPASSSFSLDLDQENGIGVRWQRRPFSAANPGFSNEIQKCSVQ
jgi:hypothetical protein